MKYLEELKPGDTFSYKEDIFVVTIDFKFKDENKYSYVINIRTGSGVWLSDTSIVEFTELYYIDKDKNIIPIKPYNNNDNIKN